MGGVADTMHNQHCITTDMDGSMGMLSFIYPFFFSYDVWMILLFLAFCHLIYIPFDFMTFDFFSFFDFPQFDFYLFGFLRF